MAKILPFRPKCVNLGCGKPVTYSHKDSSGNKRWRIHCGTCQKAAWSGQALPHGVKDFKTGICSNVDSRLGFSCLIRWDLAEPGDVRTEVDHINGDHKDNRPENLQELCPICHKKKGRLFGDYDNFKHYR